VTMVCLCRAQATDTTRGRTNKYERTWPPAVAAKWILTILGARWAVEGMKWIDLR
jgi:hypothetical protein